MVRFGAKFHRDRETGCWNWTANTIYSGYGFFKAEPRKSNVYAHRWIYEWFNGPIAEGLVIDHLCRNRGCDKTFGYRSEEHTSELQSQSNLVCRLLLEKKKTKHKKKYI